VPALEWSKIEAPDDPPLLIRYERAYAAGNTAAIAKAQNECARLGVPSPAWLTAAIYAQTEEAIEPTRKRAAGAHSKILDRINGDYVHLWRMKVVLNEFMAAENKGERISNGEAYRRAAAALVSANQMSGIAEPERAVEGSYKEAQRIIADEKRFAFIGAHFSPQHMIRSLLAAQYFASTSPTKK
jgi:hypothetical protein